VPAVPGDHYCVDPRAVIRVREWTMSLPWSRPPLSLNDRLPWQTRHRLSVQVRQAAAMLARHHRIPPISRCEVRLLYAPRDGRVRDEDGLVATLKPLCDGLVDAGVVPDDGPAFMLKPSPRVIAPQRPPALWLVVRELTRSIADAQPVRPPSLSRNHKH
jgi:crossover junction endodeoxyribonuclease RusA